MLSPWFFGSSGPAVKELSAPERLLVFLLLLVVFYPAAWLAFRAVNPIYHKAVVSAAQSYSNVADRPVTFRIVGERTFYRCYVAPAFEADLDPTPIFSNFPFLLALILVVPGMRPKKRGLVLCLAMSFLFLSHAAFLMVKIEMSLIVGEHPAAGSPAFWNFLDNFFEVYGKTFFPVLLWLAPSLPYMLGKIDSTRAQGSKVSAPRNAPCPCGSGKKFKHCCGKA